ncbi:MAG: mitofilin family membrane protein [Rhodobacteraceae bacterium]|nr:mitofilin family membrane protein [Paracoccaceae bacterium]
MARTKKTEGSDTPEAPLDPVSGPEVETPEDPAADAIQDPEPAPNVQELAPEPDQPVVPPEAPQGRGGGWFGTILGGAVAAGLGFGAAYYALPTSAPATDLKAGAGLRSQLGSQDADLAAVEARVDAFAPGANPADLAALDARLSASEAASEAARKDTAAALKALEARASALEDRLTTLERQPISGDGISAAALQSFEREVAALKSEIDAQRGESTAMEARLAQVAAEAEDRLKAAEAEAETKRALARAALSHLRAAVESGASIEGAMADLSSAGVELPAGLSEQAKGVPTSQLLQTRFDSAAREALTVSLRETAGEGWADRISAFLRSQSGARSLTPRAGDDPDAILSRADAALKAGDLAAAIDEIAALPEGGKAVMAEWVGLAQRRMAALAAVSALAQTVE